MTPRLLYRIVANRYPSFRLIASRLFRQTITPIPVQSMADLNDAPDLQTITASGVTGTDLFYVWDTSASVAKTLTFTEQRKLTLEVVGSAPNNGTVASITLNPTGSNNDIKITAAIAGTAGNSLTAAIVIDATTDRTQLTVAKGGNAITITSGDKRRMVVTGALSPDLTGSFVYNGEASGRASYAISSAPTKQAYWTSGSNKWTLASLLDIGNRWESSQDVATPDLVTSWTAVGSATGTPTVTAAAATATQAIAAGNAALDETFENGAGSDGSGAIAAVAATAFTGGAGPTASNAPFLVNGSTLYVNVGTVAAPEWKEKDLDNLS
jgi:hypothetical protein